MLTNGIIKEIVPKKGVLRPVHNDIVGCAYHAEVIEYPSGNRLLLMVSYDNSGYPRRVMTSVVQKEDYGFDVESGKNTMRVETDNSIYLFAEK